MASTDYVCNPWHCWHRWGHTYDAGGYNQPQYYGGWGWHRGWGWRRWHHWYHW